MKRQSKRQESLLSTQLLYKRRMEIISRLNDEALAPQGDERNHNKKREEQNEKPKHRRFKKKN